jgi:hypothetical protein
VVVISELFMKKFKSIICFLLMIPSFYQVYHKQNIKMLYLSYFLLIDLFLEKAIFSESIILYFIIFILSLLYLFNLKKDILSYPLDNNDSKYNIFIFLFIIFPIFILVMLLSIVVGYYFLVLIGLSDAPK